MFSSTESKVNKKRTYNMSQNNTLTMIKSINNSFHTKYLTLCKGRNFLPNREIIKNKYKLELVADRIKINEWQMIIRALEQDNSLQSIDITSRKTVQCVREQIDTEKRCRIVTAKGGPIISTKFVFSPLIKSISNCVKQSSEITCLILEGLPLTVMYIQSIANAILQNSSLKTLSFARSNLMDDGCVIICSTVKHLSNIEKINFSYCDLTDASAAHIAELIKFQTINRYSEEWMKSLRYRDPAGGAEPVGLKCLVLNGNTELTDKGLQRIIKNLRDDEWIKAIEFQNCGLADAGGISVIDCLKCNKVLAVFDVSCNPKMSKKVFNEIQKMLGADTIEADRRDSAIILRDTIDSLEQRLEIETSNRETANKMNIELHNKLMQAEELKNKQDVEVPRGYLLINEEVLSALHEQLKNLNRDKFSSPNGQDKCQLSEQSGCGDQDNGHLQDIQNHQEISRRIQQEYADAYTCDLTEVHNLSEDQITSGDERNLLMTNKGKMKSVYTMLNEAVNTDEATHSEQN